ncbi:MAG: tRNA pseudouridine(38-40) synthase TruA [Cytophagaceae bacterium]|jgi:tRNA pseudouridine38-40 synthase|nr:tRNA pseudouridine(38-40) synthase TruA [Cytophagaceae bacterium]
MRYFLEIAYHGGAYHGWQRQPNALGVQEVIEGTMRTLFRAPALEITGSGRTDTGVHASYQVAHFDVEQEINGHHLFRLNCMLPSDIALLGVHPVPDTAHARFDAIRRGYEYHIGKRKSPFAKGLSWTYERPLDIQLMNEAASLLLQYEDFQCFSKTHTDVDHYRCRIEQAFWKEGNHEYIFYITANRFLRGMVRAIVGSLLPIGQGKIPVSHFRSILESRDRRQAGAAASPEGLYLCRVDYPPDLFQPSCHG